MVEQKVSNERKKELEQLDPFQEKLLTTITFIKAYKKQLGMIAGAIVLIIVVFSSIMYSFKKSENTASALMSQALISYSKADDPKKGFELVKNDFAAIFKDYANTASGKLSRVEFAKICFDAQRYDESLQYYEQALELFKNQALMENFILVSLGHANLAKKDAKSARKYFDQVEASQTDLLKDEALFALAVMGETDGNMTESNKLYNKIVSDYPTSIYYAIAKSKIEIK